MLPEIFDKAREKKGHFYEVRSGRSVTQSIEKGLVERLIVRSPNDRSLAGYALLPEMTNPEDVMGVTSAMMTTVRIQKSPRIEYMGEERTFQFLLFRPDGVLITGSGRWMMSYQAFYYALDTLPSLEGVFED